MKLIFLLLLLISSSFCVPWLNLWFPRQSSYDNRNIEYANGQDGPYQQYRQGRGGKERWKQICKTINPDSYAFPGRVPYPAAPVCPW